MATGVWRTFRAVVERWTGDLPVHHVEHTHVRFAGVDHAEHTHVRFPVPGGNTETFGIFIV